MSNNIYDILKKMQSLETPKANLTEGKKAKPDFLDMDKDGDTKEPMKKAVKDKSKGAVAEAIAQVERQLNEKYQGFKKAAATDKKMVKELDPNYKAPESDYFHAREITAPVAAWDNDEQGQKQYKDRTAPGVINKVKDFVGYDKPNPAYGPRDTKVKEGEANEDVLTPKQKKFAKLAPPPDKITYADKIAGAKKTNEGFPTVADAEKRMREKEGKTAHGKKTTTAAGTRHERDYDAVDKGADVDMTPKGRGRPKKDRFA